MKKYPKSGLRPFTMFDTFGIVRYWYASVINVTSLRDVFSKHSLISKASHLYKIGYFLGLDSKGIKEQQRLGLLTKILSE